MAANTTAFKEREREEKKNTHTKEYRTRQKWHTMDLIVVEIVVNVPFLPVTILQNIFLLNATHSTAKARKHCS